MYFCTLDSIPLIYIPIHILVPTCLEFVVNAKIKKCESSIVVFFFSRMFGYPGSLAFLCGLELSEGRKEARGGWREGQREEGRKRASSAFNRDGTESVNKFGECIHFLCLP